MEFFELRIDETLIGVSHYYPFCDYTTTSKCHGQFHINKIQIQAQEQEQHVSLSDSSTPIKGGNKK